MQSEESTTKTSWGNSPILWLLGGVIFTALVIISCLLIASQQLSQNSPEPAAVGGPPTIIRITAPATPIPTNTPIIPTPTSEPTLTPSPTPDRLVAPEELTDGFYAQVANTDGVGVNFRNGYGRSNELILVLEEGVVGLVIEGPIDSDGFVWWRLELEDMTQGWVVAQFLIPSAEPNDWRSP
ncbi:MAG: hypothetical protein AB8G95_15180 [Anaerolineae bacterium]